MSSNKELFSFKELATNIEFNEQGASILDSSIGEGLSFEADLFAPSTNVRNSEPDELLGTSIKFNDGLVATNSINH